VSNKNVYPCLLFLSKHSLGLFKVATDIVCYDTPSKEARFFLVYNLLSVAYNLRVRVITKVSEASRVLSVTSLY
jgi:NADH:ubiquinone oxidoreductase subunit C